MERDNITKSDLAGAVAEFSGLSLADSAEVVEFYFKAIEKGLKEDGEVKIMGLGTFTRRSKKARMGRNPKTGKPAAIPARNVISFRPAKALKTAL